MRQAGTIRTFKDLVAWQKAFQLCLNIYRATARFPAEERFGLTAETRKTARSVINNIAEGHKRRSTVEYIRFPDIAAGSGAELETQLLLGKALDYLSPEPAAGLLSAYYEVERMLQALIHSLERKLPPRHA
mgnify:CR=1 FL=1